MQRGLGFAVLFAGTIVGAQPGAAEAILAIGIPPNITQQGYVYGYAFGADAATTALNICRGTKLPPGVVMPENAPEAKRRCTVAGSFADQCFAIAVDVPNLAPGATGVGWAIAADSLTAERQALAGCQVTAGPGRRAACEVRKSICDGSAK
jgi:Domain of unknown function (DUF4189)